MSSPEQPPDQAPEPAPTPEDGERERTTPQPRIWVGSWSDYNNGILHGDWIDAAREPDEIAADIENILKASPTATKYGEVAEDWGIFDYENFGPLRVGESDTVAHVTAVARGITAHGLAFAAWADLVQDLELLHNFDEAYLGEYDSLQAYAEQLIEDLGYDQILDDNLPDHIRRYVDINLAGLAQDMWLSGDVMVCHRPGGGVWLFRGQ